VLALALALYPAAHAHAGVAAGGPGRAAAGAARRAGRRPAPSGGAEVGAASFGSGLRWGSSRRLQCRWTAAVWEAAVMSLVLAASSGRNERCWSGDGHSTTRRGGVMRAKLKGAAGPHPYNDSEGRGGRQVTLGRTQVGWWKETRRNQPRTRPFYFSDQRAEVTDRNDPARLA
jgi:hypothetical protein